MLRLLKYMVISFGVLVASLSIGYAQIDPTIAILNEAREQATRNRHNDALQIITKGLSEHPANYDLLVMRIRILGWKGEYGVAIDELGLMKKNYPENLELLELEMDLRYWSNQFTALIKFCDEILAINPTHLTAYYRKAVAQYELNLNEEALQTLTQTLKIAPANTEALALERIVQERLLKNEIGVSYRYSTFSEVFTDWHNTSLYYTRNTNVGPLIFRGSWARQFEQTGFQYEIDMYPRLSRKTYAYVNAGFSNADIFPSTRFGAELFQTFPAGFEASLGMRYMYYQVSDDKLWIYTGNATKYFNNNMLSYRPMVTQLRDEITLTSILTFRHYLSNRDHYWGLIAAYGRAPVDFVSIVEILRLRASRFGLEYQLDLPNNFFLKTSAEFQHEEYFDNVFRQRYALEVLLSKRF